MTSGPVIDWLLSEEDPSVRYFTLTDLLGRPAGDPHARAARDAISSSPVAAKIFSAQRPDGAWVSPKEMYQPKYRSTLWQMIILAELGVPGEDQRVRAAMETHILPYLERATGGLKVRDIHCLMGYSLFFLHRLGYIDHPVARRFAEVTVAAYQVEDWPCKYASRPDCTWGMIKVLRALAALPAGGRPPGTDRVVARAAEGLLEHRFWFEEPVPDRPYVTNRDWLRFGFPLFYQSDLLEMLLAVKAAGLAGHPRFGRLLREVEGRRGPDGTWVLGRGFNRQMHVTVEPAGRPSRWVTLRALQVMAGS